MKKKYILYGTASLSIATVLSNINNVEAFNNKEFSLNKEIKFDLKNIKNSENTVNIEDKNLLKAINNQLGRGEVLDDVTIEDMESLTTLDAKSRNIKHLNGLEYAVNLNNLNLGSNNISDISQLYALTKLSILYLYDNKITDISPLSSLTELKELYISHFDKNGNDITNISPIANLTKLEKLNVSKNNISDISHLSNLIRLKELYIHGNEIYDISPLKNLVNLTRLELGRGEYVNGKQNQYGNKINDLNPLSSLINLKYLTLAYNEISDISDIAGLTNLNTLYLNNNKITDIKPVANFDNLMTLYANDNQITDIDALTNLIDLTYLKLSNNKISNISPLGNLINLTNLQMYNNEITDISSLIGLTKLTVLYLQNNNISNISPLVNSVELVDLQLNNNQISDISILSRLTKLTTLYLYNNEISNIASLTNLTNLKTLYLHNNQISDINSLNDLSQINKLNLSGNQIVDIEIIGNLSNLTNLAISNNRIIDILSISKLSSLTNLSIENNQISDISALGNLANLTSLNLYNNQISDISPLENLTSLTNLNITNQKPNITTSDFKTEFNSLDININNPLVGLNNNFNISNISNRGVYENNKLKWNNLSLGSHSNTFNFSQEVKIGSATSTFSGTATINFNIIDGGAPESDHISDFDEDAFEIYTTVTATDLGEGVSHLIHKGVRHNLPYRFKYDVYDSSNNIVDVYDLVGNKEEYQVKLKDTDVPTIDTGINALKNKDSINSSDIKYFRTIVNELEESSNKDLLQDKLNLLTITDTLERKTATANLDLYIKSENMLSMNLSTNSIVFEDFSGVEDLEKSNAIEISINSSLPYQLNSYLISEIQNADKSEIVDKSLLNIKESNSNDYKAFANINEKLVLKDNCSNGNGNIHNIDLRLNGNNAHTADIYKTVIKIEVEQK